MESPRIFKVVVKDVPHSYLGQEEPDKTLGSLNPSDSLGSLPGKVVE